MKRLTLQQRAVMLRPKSGFQIWDFEFFSLTEQVTFSLIAVEYSTTVRVRDARSQQQSYRWKEDCMSFLFFNIYLPAFGRVYWERGGKAK